MSVGETQHFFPISITNITNSQVYKRVDGDGELDWMNFKEKYQSETLMIRMVCRTENVKIKIYLNDPT